ncbi:helix-turn-helix domain-containing protein [Sphingomonas sp. Root241]|uniref:helix-turn-helix domain-containing protein n=1 Tax=Sphingomonas sp. Root241 TaxID=1736501 RepID=UPI0009EA8959|nr:helix-turn-helix domain-containing protein [Sphingomonas sp. Root241]
MLRKQLDRQVAPYRTLRPFRPSPGWITAIRRAVGLSANMLANRMGMNRATVVRLEQREVTEEISLKALRMMAEALDCSLLYALVPRQSLEERTRQRATELADAMLASGQQGSRSAGKVASDEVRTRLIDDLLSGDPRRLWQPGD